ncbi:hypothetical protein [Mesorhizobium silamurunense]|uniref:hypothetical protein n=1 Tax=Mesorhizobium silamurunense TaxID=499528 RepID=UPI0017807A4A|nr:hypothetical protein [Mesorhizobium silamurunense]
MGALHGPTEGINGDTVPGMAEAFGTGLGGKSAFYSSHTEPDIPLAAPIETLNPKALTSGEKMHVQRHHAERYEMIFGIPHEKYDVINALTTAARPSNTVRPAIVKSLQSANVGIGGCVCPQPISAKNSSKLSELLAFCFWRGN